MSDMTFHINLILIGFAVLAVLLLLINLAIHMLRSAARQHAAKSDLEQIGHEAIVTKTIRPGKPGQIRYLVEDGYRTTMAEADSTIRNGHSVVIQAVIHDHFRVRRQTADVPALTEQSRTAVIVDRKTPDAAKDRVADSQQPDAAEHDHLAADVSPGEDHVQ